MKLDNKGFAITAVLYGLLILFVILVSAYLMVLSAKKNRIDNLIGDIVEDYNSGNNTLQNVNLKEHITNLYLNNINATPVTNGGIEYNYASAVRLMNDRLGNNDVDINGGNIRYYGASDGNLKNYIYFNCSDYLDTSTCEVWRIVGIVDGKVKIMKNVKLDGVYKYGNSSNIWSNSIIQTLLNSGEFYTSLQSTNNKTLDLTSSSTWYVNGSSSSSVYVNSVYNDERSGTTWSGNVAILYPSDYGYATDLNVCDEKINSYDTGCVSNNWMTNIVTNNSNNSCWLITPYSGASNMAWYIDEDSGKIGHSSGIAYTRAVVPTLYLDSSLNVDSNTDGSSGNPFKLIVS